MKLAQCAVTPEFMFDKLNQRSHSLALLTSVMFIGQRGCLNLYARPWRAHMSIPPQPNIRILNSPEYRDGYANSVQVRVSVWDFLLIFGRLQPLSTEEVEVHNFQGVYLSPQQAKALVSILQQNIHQYESAFGEIKLDANIMPPGGPIH
jgi:uncharacterized protein DUF3467